MLIYHCQSICAILDSQSMSMLTSAFTWLDLTALLLLILTYWLVHFTWLLLLNFNQHHTIQYNLVKYTHKDHLICSMSCAIFYYFVVTFFFFLDFLVDKNCVKSCIFTNDLHSSCRWFILLSRSLIGATIKCN